MPVSQPVPVYRARKNGWPVAAVATRDVLTTDPGTRVILMMDVGGSMDPYARLVEQLFSAAARATHFKEFRSYYFHNCVYEGVWKDNRRRWRDY